VDAFLGSLVATAAPVATSPGGSSGSTSRLGDTSSLAARTHEPRLGATGRLGHRPPVVLLTVHMRSAIFNLLARRMGAAGVREGKAKPDPASNAAFLDCSAAWARLSNATHIYVAADHNPADMAEHLQANLTRASSDGRRDVTILSYKDLVAFQMKRMADHARSHLPRPADAASDGPKATTTVVSVAAAAEEDDTWRWPGLADLADSLMLGRGQVCVGTPGSTFSKLATNWWGARHCEVLVEGSIEACAPVGGRPFAAAGRCGGGHAPQSLAAGSAGGGRRKAWGSGSGAAAGTGGMGGGVSARGKAVGSVKDTPPVDALLPCAPLPGSSNPAAFKAPTPQKRPRPQKPKSQLLPSRPLVGEAWGEAWGESAFSGHTAKDTLRCDGRGCAAPTEALLSEVRSQCFPVPDCPTSPADAGATGAARGRELRKHSNPPARGSACCALNAAYEFPGRPSHSSLCDAQRARRDAGWDAATKELHAAAGARLAGKAAAPEQRPAAAPLAAVAAPLANPGSSVSSSVIEATRSAMAEVPAGEGGAAVDVAAKMKGLRPPKGPRPPKWNSMSHTQRASGITGEKPRPPPAT
jgi:hypothetical protein